MSFRWMSKRRPAHRGKLRSRRPGPVWRRNRDPRSPVDVVRQAALFGTRNRDGWDTGLTILTALGQLRPFLSEEETGRGAWPRIATVHLQAGRASRWQLDPTSPP
jgi:hypothetical protein